MSGNVTEAPVCSRLHEDDRYQHAPEVCNTIPHHPHTWHDDTHVMSCPGVDPATVCVRLDGLADKIARAIASDDYSNDGGKPWSVMERAEQLDYEQNGAAIVALLQSLAVQ